MIRSAQCHDALQVERYRQGCCLLNAYTIHREGRWKPSAHENGCGMHLESQARRIIPASFRILHAEYIDLAVAQHLVIKQTSISEYVWNY